MHICKYQLHQVTCCTPTRIYVIGVSETVKDHQQKKVSLPLFIPRCLYCPAPLPCFFHWSDCCTPFSRNSLSVKGCLNQGLPRLWKWSLTFNTTAILSLVSAWCCWKNHTCLTSSSTENNHDLRNNQAGWSPPVSSYETAEKQLHQLHTLGR